MKRKWLMIPLVTGILAAGITGATVLAHNDDGEQESPKDTVATKVAEILGIDAETVKDALQEATQEVRSERLQHRLDDLVEAGKLTQDQADAYMEWYEARPDVPNLHRNGHRLFGFGGGGEGENGELRLSSGQREFRGQRFDGQDFPGRGQRVDGGDASGFRQLPNGRDFSGRGDLRSAFGQRSNGLEFPGQGILPPALGGEIPEANGASY